MAITPPQPQTMVDATAWGQPITNAVNALAGFRSGSQVGNAGTWANLQAIISASIPAVPVARLVSVSYHLYVVVATAAGVGEIQFLVNGTANLSWRLNATATGSQMVAFSRQGISLAANATMTFSAQLANSTPSVVTYADPLFNMLTWLTVPVGS